MDEGHGDEDMKQGEDQETNILDDDLALLVVATARDSTWVRTIEALNRRSLLLINSAKLDEAYVTLQKALDMTCTLVGGCSTSPDETELEYVLRSTTLNNLSVYYHHRKEYRLAWKCAQRALRLDMLITAYHTARSKNAENGEGWDKAGISTEKKFPTLGEKHRLFTNPAVSHLNMCAILSSMKRHQSAVLHAECALGQLSRGLHELTRQSRHQHWPCEDRQATLESIVQLSSVAFHNLAVEYEHLRQYAASTAAYRRAHLFALRHTNESSPITSKIIATCLQATKCFADDRRMLLDAATLRKQKRSGEDGMSEREGVADEGMDEGGNNQSEDVNEAEGQELDSEHERGDNPTSRHRANPVTKEHQLRIRFVMNMPAVSVMASAARFTRERDHNRFPMPSKFVSLTAPATPSHALSGRSGVPRFVLNAIRHPSPRLKAQSPLANVASQHPDVVVRAALQNTSNSSTSPTTAANNVQNVKTIPRANSSRAPLQQAAKPDPSQKIIRPGREPLPISLNRSKISLAGSNPSDASSKHLHDQPSLHSSSRDTQSQQVRLLSRTTSTLDTIKSREAARYSPSRPGFLTSRSLRRTTDVSMQPGPTTTRLPTRASKPPPQHAVSTSIRSQNVAIPFPPSSPIIGTKSIPHSNFDVPETSQTANYTHLRRAQTNPEVSRRYYSYSYLVRGDGGNPLHDNDYSETVDGLDDVVDDDDGDVTIDVANHSSTDLDHWKLWDKSFRSHQDNPYT